MIRYRYYMDIHVHGAITRGLRARGIDVLTGQEDGFDRALDPRLFRRATELNRLLFTQDKGFLRIAADAIERNEHFHGIVFARQQVVPIHVCIEDLELIAQLGTPDEIENRVLHLPLVKSS